jgi:hypothetical protein
MYGHSQNVLGDGHEVVVALERATNKTPPSRPR